MADQIVFNDSLSLASGLGTTTLTGTLDVTYGTTPSVSGSLSLSAGPGLPAQVFTGLTVAQTGTAIDGTPLYTLTGTNAGANISIGYAGALPTSVTTNVASSLNVPLASGVGTVVSAIVCFAAGTRLATPRGEIAVEKIKVGDEVLTASGARRVVKWTGHRTIDCRRHHEPRAVMPVRIAADAFAPGKPSRDLYVSPGHAMLVQVMDEVLIPASLLVNGTTVAQIEVDEVTYWHVELESHDIVLAEGLPTESYIDVGNRAFFSTGRGRPDGTIDAASLADYCRPYLTDAGLTRAVRGRLQARAVDLGWSLDMAPHAGLHILADGEIVMPEVDGLIARFTLPARSGDIWLVSETSVPAHVAETWDARKLGVCLRSLTLGTGDARTDIAIADPLLCVGFHPAEGEAETRCRWTTGRALLPAALWRGNRGRVVLEVALAGPSVPRWVAPAAGTTGGRRFDLAVAA